MLVQWIRCFRHCRLALVIFAPGGAFYVKNWFSTTCIAFAGLVLRSWAKWMVWAWLLSWLQESCRGPGQLWFNSMISSHTTGITYGMGLVIVHHVAACTLLFTTSSFPCLFCGLFLVEVVRGRVVPDAVGAVGWILLTLRMVDSGSGYEVILAEVVLSLWSS